MKKIYLTFLFLIITKLFFAQNQPFVTTWEVDNVNGLDIFIPTEGSGYNYTIDFGDGIVQNNVNGGITHIYNTPGIYTVTINGTFPRIYFNDDGFGTPINNSKIKSVEQWGDIAWHTMNNAFKDCENLIVNATDAPDLSQVTDMSGMFSGCENFNQSINHWDVSNITTLWNTFIHADSFNQPLNNWDVSNVTDMRNTFQLASAFNQPLDNWDVSNVIYMGRMFNGASSFNQPIGGWDVSSLTSMYSMFASAVSFNQPLNNWDVSNVNSMGYVFSQAFNFNQALDNWDVTNVTGMSWMFLQANSFNYPLNDWDVSNVTDMAGMFSGATSFNQPLNTWDVSNVLDMTTMFNNTPLFNQDISSWDFNQNIIFQSNPTLLNGFLEDGGLDIQNYDLLLARFVNLGLSNKNLITDGLEYCDEESRDELINNLGWSINGDNLSDDCDLSFDDLKLESVVNLYPNPVYDLFYIQPNHGTKIQELSVYNIQGEQILFRKGNVEILDLENLSSGIYLLKLKTDQGTLNQQLIKK